MNDFEFGQSPIQDNPRPADFKSQLFYRFGLQVVRSPLLFVLIPLALCLVLTAGVVSLGSTPDSRIFFSDDNPQLQALEVMEAEFSKSDNIFIASLWTELYSLRVCLN